jgi:hypothetical protein
VARGNPVAECRSALERGAAVRGNLVAECGRPCDR